MTATGDNQTVAPRRWLPAACLIAAATHIFFYAYQPDTPPSPDEQEYLSLGVGLAHTGELRLPSGEVAKRMPLYPVFIAGIYRWQSGELWQNGVLLFQMFLAWCTTIWIALTAEQIADGRAGLLAAVIAAFYAPFRFLQMSFLTETLVIFFLCLALLVYMRAGIRRPSAAGLVTVSALLGLATLTRANALLFLVPFFADTVLRDGKLRQRILRGALICLPALACAGAWGLRNERLLGQFTLSTSGGLNFYLGSNPHFAKDPGMGDSTDYAAFDRLRREQGLSELEADQHLYDEGLAFIRENPGRAVLNAVLKIGVWLRTTVAVSAPSLPVLILGVLVLHGWSANRVCPLTGKRRLVYLAASAGFCVCLVFWFLVLLETSRLWTTPLYVVPVGSLALLLLRTKPSVRGLLLGLFASQLMVAVTMVPLERLRWTVDGILILATAVVLSQSCRWLISAQQEPAALAAG